MYMTHTSLILDNNKNLKKWFEHRLIKGALAKSRQNKQFIKTFFYSEKIWN